MANKAQTTRNRRKTKSSVAEEVLHVDPIVLSKEGGSSDMESDDIVNVVATR